MRRRLNAMASAMRHRGPDDEGVFVSTDGRAGLVNRRLAVRDLSPAGHMPMQSAEGNVVITYNGEIYNADELREELGRLAYTFRSSSDTEVILQGYMAWGIDVITRLRGMFAFALLDLRPAMCKLFLGRDHLGVKPLYYSWDGHCVVFGSELNTVLASGLVSREINATGLVGYLQLGSVPSPLTIYRDIFALEAASYITFDLTKSAAPCPATYWHPPSDTSTVALRDAVELVRGRLEEAVRIRLVSDVPLGAFLSGGLDSSTVVALMRKATTATIRTCSMVFEEAEFSEAVYARTMAAHVGAEHYERVVTVEDMKREFTTILRALDQPSVDGVNTYFVSQTAREAGLTVALSGLGGDELFAGYQNTFHQAPQLYRLLKLLESIPYGVAGAQGTLRRLPVSPRWSAIVDAVERPSSRASTYVARRCLFTASQARSLVSAEIWQEAGHFDAVEYVARATSVANRTSQSVDPVAWTSKAELSTYTHNQLLRDTDVMSMVHSLEVREPLLDVRLVETMLRLPAAVKMSGSSSKPLLVQAAGDLLPPLITAPRVKQGFVFPLPIWLQTVLAPLAKDSLAAIANTGTFRSHSLDAIVSDFERQRLHWSRYWALIALAPFLNSCT